MPYLLFNGNCAEAMNFYQSCFGGELTLSRTGDTPMKDQFPPEKHDKIINSHLKSGFIEISASDWHADAFQPKDGNTFGIFVPGDNYEEMKTLFTRLADGCDKNPLTFVELREMPFGVYGQLVDRFNVSWKFAIRKN